MLYGIEIASFEAADKGFGKKGGFRLEYLNGYVPPVPEKKSSSLKWIILAIVLLAVAASIFFAMRKYKSEPVEIVRTDTVTVVVRDTVYVQQVKNIQTDFNAAQFAVNSIELNDKAQAALKELAKVISVH